jgi:tetratricopeptide (TPR) repeat protein
MIERLLAAEAMLERGELESAGRLFAQVAEADARNAIAVVGLARIASLEGRFADAHELLDRALSIDPAEAAARRLLVEIATAPSDAGARGAGAIGVGGAGARAPAPSAPEPAPAKPASLIERLRRWLGLGRQP